VARTWGAHSHEFLLGHVILRSQSFLLCSQRTQLVLFVARRVRSHGVRLPAATRSRPPRERLLRVRFVWQCARPEPQRPVPDEKAIPCASGQSPAARTWRRRTLEHTCKCGVAAGPRWPCRRETLDPPCSPRLPLTDVGVGTAYTRAAQRRDHSHDTGVPRSPSRAHRRSAHHARRGVGGSIEEWVELRRRALPGHAPSRCTALKSEYEDAGTTSDTGGGSARLSHHARRRVLPARHSAAVHREDASTWTLLDAPGPATGTGVSRAALAAWYELIIHQRGGGGAVCAVYGEGKLGRVPGRRSAGERDSCSVTGAVIASPSVTSLYSLRVSFIPRLVGGSSTHMLIEVGSKEQEAAVEKLQRLYDEITEHVNSPWDTGMAFESVRPRPPALHWLCRTPNDRLSHGARYIDASSTTPSGQTKPSR
jgi:hypothetical protein